MGWLEDVWETLTGDKKDLNLKTDPKNVRPGSQTFGQKGTYGIGQGYNTDRAIPGRNVRKTSEAARNYNGPMARRDPLAAFRTAPTQPAQTIPGPKQRQPSNPGMNILADGGRVQDDYGLSDIVAGINAAMDTPYGGIDPAIEAMLNNAFGAQFSAIDKARGTANSNYQQSDKNLEGLYAGHVNDINTVDADRYKQITQDWRGSVANNYDSTINAAQADRNAEAERQAAMMKNLGLEQSAPVANESADLLSEGIQSMQADKAGAINTADTYGSADLTRNVARGQAVASQGLANRADLMGQLQSILGQLDNKRVDTEREKAMAFLEADNQSRDAWRDDRAVNVESLAQLLEQQRADTALRREESWRDEDRNFEREMADRDYALKQQEATAGAGHSDPFQSILAPMGVDPTPWRNAYADWTRDTNFSSISGVPLNVELSRYFQKRGLDPALSPVVGLGIEKTGTRKYNE